MEKSITIKNVDSIKNQLVNTILIVGTSIGLLAFISAQIPFEPELINTDFFLDLIGLSALFLTYLFRQKLSLLFRANMIIAMLFVLFVSDVLENGLDTPDVVLVVLIPFLSILIYSFRVTILLYASTILIYLTIGILFSNGVISSDYYDPSGDSFFRWIEVVLVISVVTVMITLFMNKFNATIYQLIGNLEIQKQDSVERESLLSVITKNIPRTILTVIDRDLIIRYTEGIDYKKWKLDPETFIGMNALDTLKVFGDEKVQLMKKSYESAFEGNIETVELVFGEDILLYKILPLEIQDGEIRQILVVTENITEQVQTQNLITENLHEKNVLLQEIHHRVKNNLAVVSGLLSLQSFKVKDPNSKYILNKSTNRIMSIAKVHEMLYESKNFTKIPFNRYINELSTIIIDSMNFDDKAIEFNTDINVDYISINHGVPLGIIFNELITNSVKYGFNGSQDNTIKICVNQNNERFEVSYEDNGKGIEDFDVANSKSLGFTLIESLMQQIEADFEYQTKDRFKLSFSFPADEVEQPIPELS